MAELQNVGDTYCRYIWVEILEGQGKSLLVEDSWKSKRKYKMEIQKYKLKSLPGWRQLERKCNASLVAVCNQLLKSLKRRKNGIFFLLLFVVEKFVGWRQLQP